MPDNNSGEKHERHAKAHPLYLDLVAKKAGDANQRQDENRLNIRRFREYLDEPVHSPLNIQRTKIVRNIH